MNPGRISDFLKIRVLRSRFSAECIFKKFSYTPDGARKYLYGAHHRRKTARNEKTLAPEKKTGEAGSKFLFKPRERIENHLSLFGEIDFRTICTNTEKSNQFRLPVNEPPFSKKNVITTQRYEGIQIMRKNRTQNRLSRGFLEKISSTAPQENTN